MDYTKDLCIIPCTVQINHFACLSKATRNILLLLLFSFFSVHVLLLLDTAQL